MYSLEDSVEMLCRKGGVVVLRIAGDGVIVDNPETHGWARRPGGHGGGAGACRDGGIGIAIFAGEYQQFR